MTKERNEEVFAVRVEALTYNGKAVNKDNNPFDDEPPVFDQTSVWKFYDVVYGTREEIDRKILESPFFLRAVERNQFIRNRIRKYIGNNADLNSLKGIKKIPTNVGINQPMNFVEIWRN